MKRSRQDYVGRKYKQDSFVYEIVSVTDTDLTYRCIYNESNSIGNLKPGETATCKVSDISRWVDDELPTFKEYYEGIIKK